MKELFENQLYKLQPLTEDTLDKIQNKTYFNGEEKKVNDVVLTAILIDNIKLENGEYKELSLKFISLNERHFDLFESDDRYVDNYLPTIKLK